MSSCYFICKTASLSWGWLFLCLSLIGFVPISASAFDRYTAHGGPVRDLALSPDGKHFVTASFDYSAVLWSADEIAEKSTLIGHEAALNTAQFSPDGKLLATGGDDRGGDGNDDVVGGPPLQDDQLRQNLLPR